jgi:carbon monoxide dehydrogenase subunit G
VPTVERLFTVAPDPGSVLSYLQDFANAEEWDPGTQRCVRTDAGLIGVGSTWHNTSKVAGVTTELKYTLERSTPDQLVFVGTNAKATSTDTITVTPFDRGSQIRYRAELEMHGAAKLASPVMKLIFERIATATEHQMTEVLNHLKR